MTHACAGRCHCGAVRLALELSKPPAEHRLRACQCGFCRPRGVRTIADAGGMAVLTVPAEDQLLRYRFGLACADYLVCRGCGSYAAAVMPDGARLISVVNVAGLDVAEFRGRDGDHGAYDGETLEARLARRRQYWMPIRIAFDA
jgi:hypothetical protein